MPPTRRSTLPKRPRLPNGCLPTEEVTAAPVQRRLEEPAARLAFLCPAATRTGCGVDLRVPGMVEPVRQRLRRPARRPAVVRCEPLRMLKSCNNLCRGRDARARDEGSAGLRPCMNGHAGGCCRVLKGSSRGSRLSMACSGPRCLASRNMNSAFRGGSGPLERQPCRMSQPGARRRSMRAWRSTPSATAPTNRPPAAGTARRRCRRASEEGQEAVPHPGALRRSPGPVNAAMVSARPICGRDKAGTCPSPHEGPAARSGKVQAVGKAQRR